MTNINRYNPHKQKLLESAIILKSVKRSWDHKVWELLWFKRFNLWNWVDSLPKFQSRFWGCRGHQNKWKVSYDYDPFNPHVLTPLWWTTALIFVKSLRITSFPPHISLLVFETMLFGRLVAKSCLTLCDPVDCSPSGSSVHGIL